MDSIEYIITAEEYNLSKLEECCYKLRDGILDCSLKIPEISTFKRYIEKIQDYESIEYITELLHKCWCVANPYYLTNAIPKDISLTEQFEMVLNQFPNYPKNKLDGTVEFDKTFNPLCAVYQRERYSCGYLEFCYSHYMKELHKIVNEKLNSIEMNPGVNLNEMFLLCSYLITDKGTQQIIKVFNLIRNEPYNFCAPSKENRQVFLSLFNCSISAPERTIEWLDTGSSVGNKPSIASIYTIFSTLGVDMNSNNKKIISRYFLSSNKKIKHDSIRARLDIDKQKQLQNDILAVLESEETSR